MESGLSSVYYYNAVIRATLLRHKDTADEAAQAIVFFRRKAKRNKGFRE